jgi:flagellar protein FlgJ
MEPVANSYNYTGFDDLARLRRASSKAPDKSLVTVARQFEALFTQMIFKSMRNAQLASGLFDNNQTKMYQDILDKQLSANLSTRGGLGIADLLVQQLSDSRRIPLQDSGAITVTDKSGGTGYDSRKSSSSSVSAPGAFNSRKGYIDTISPIAEKLEERYKIPARSLLAQSALETGWGKHIIRNEDGTPSYNLFGIKAGADWHGKVAVSRTLEFIDGTPVARDERFRSYNSFEDSMQDYAKHIANNPRYASAYQQRSDPRQYFAELQLAGYATDPDYASKINGIIDKLG